MADIAMGNPKVAGDINIVLCISGRTSVVGKNSDAFTREIDPTDNIERLRLSIRIAQGASALRGNTVEVVYNGTADENDDLRIFLAACKDAAGVADFQKKQPELHKYLSNNYEAGEVERIISEFKEASGFLKVKYGIEMEDVQSDTQTRIRNTRDQAEAFNNYFDKDFKNPPVIAVISSAFHLPRVARAFSKAQENSPDTAFGCATLILSGIDLECKRPGIEIDLQSEPDAITNYIANGGIALRAGKNVYYGSKISREDANTRVASELNRESKIGEILPSGYSSKISEQTRSKREGVSLASLLALIITYLGFI